MRSHVIIENTPLAATDIEPGMTIRMSGDRIVVDSVQMMIIKGRTAEFDSTTVVVKSDSSRHGLLVVAEGLELISREPVMLANTVQNGDQLWVVDRHDPESKPFVFTVDTVEVTNSGLMAFYDERLDFDVMFPKTSYVRFTGRMPRHQ